MSRSSSSIVWSLPHNIWYDYKDQKTIRLQHFTFRLYVNLIIVCVLYPPTLTLSLKYLKSIKLLILSASSQSARQRFGPKFEAVMVNHDGVYMALGTIYWHYRAEFSAPYVSFHLRLYSGFKDCSVDNAHNSQAKRFYYGPLQLMFTILHSKMLLLRAV